ncbi:MAG TPA: hypothetical protein VH518_04805 [Tepidisphaeraceae bacterium]|jgi:hypothetical protein
MIHRRLSVVLTTVLVGATLAPSLVLAQQQRDRQGGGGWRQRNGNGNGNGNNNWRGGGNDSRSSDRAGPTTSGSYSDQYGVLTDRNIFMRDRSSRRDRGDVRRSFGPTTPEQSYVLTGIVFEDGDYHAYFEDLNRGGVQKLVTGGSIARGQISDIEIDGVEYAGTNGQTAWVEIGSNLTGTRIGSVSAERVNAALGSGGGGATAAPGALPNIDPNNPNLTVEERMRLRRMQEQNPGMATPVPAGGEGDAGDQGAGAATEENGPPQQPQQQPPQGPGAGQPAGAGAGPGAAGTSNLSVEEQMRLRRAQELGR